MTTHPRIPQTTGRRTSAVLILVSAWSVLMLIMSVLWSTGAAHAPFGHPLPGQFTSVLDHLPVPLGAGLIGFVALISLCVSAVLLTAPKLRSVRLTGVVALALTVVTTVLFTDTLLLAYLGYTLSLQFPPIPVEVVWQAVMLLGAGLWIGVWASEDHDARRLGGRRSTGPRPVSADAKVAVALAILVPLFYASTRILWALGIPLGLSEEFYAKGLELGLWRSGLSLALAGVVGALLTLGLVQRWGERLPRWAGPLAGKRVPILLATLPASLISLALFTGGMGMVREVLLGETGIPGSWTTYGPVLLFPLWGLALGWATLRYRSRRLGD